MTYEEIVESVRKRLKGVDTSSVKDLLAIQVNITGEGEGAFYVEVKDGVLSVEPYEYFDRQAKITMKSKNFLALMEGKMFGKTESIELSQMALSRFKLFVNAVQSSKFILVKINEFIIKIAPNK